MVVISYTRNSITTSMNGWYQLRRGSSQFTRFWTFHSQQTFCSSEPVIPQLFTYVWSYVSELFYKCSCVLNVCANNKQRYIIELWTHIGKNYWHYYSIILFERAYGYNYKMQLAMVFLYGFIVPKKALKTTSITHFENGVLLVYVSYQWKTNTWNFLIIILQSGILKLNIHL